MKHPYTSMRMRHRLQWIYALATLTVLTLGWKFPILGYMVALAMTGAMISAFLAGRWFCGNLCPRGGFLERIVGLYSPGKPVPAWINSTKVRIGVLIFLFLMVGINASRNPTSWEHWGFVFWLICLVTSTVGLIMALFWNARSWCAICPMGSVQSWIGGRKYALDIETQQCGTCKRCERVCPMHLHIIDRHPSAHTIFSGDCIRCGECVAACPTKTLHFTGSAQH